MAIWTNADKIKALLMSLSIPDQVVYNNRVILSLFEDSYLLNTNVDVGSLVLKIIRQAAPSLDPASPISLANTTPFALGHQRLVWNSVVVADSIGLGTVYVENSDYIVDYFTGAIRRSNVGSTIPNPGNVWVWYVPFTILALGNDYNIDYDEGTIVRRAGTTIPDGATVYCDYSHSQVSVTDELISQCIGYAEALIQSNLNPTYTVASTDLGLQAGCSLLTMHLVSMSMAQRELRLAPHANSDDIAKQWVELANLYALEANTHLSPFIKQLFLNAGGVIENRFASERSRSIVSPTVTAGYRKR